MHEKTVRRDDLNKLEFNPDSEYFLKVGASTAVSVLGILVVLVRKPGKVLNKDSCCRRNRDFESRRSRRLHKEFDADFRL
jgi:hypothetical protein